MICCRTAVLDVTIEDGSTMEVPVLDDFADLVAELLSNTTWCANVIVHRAPAREVQSRPVDGDGSVRDKDGQFGKEDDS